MRAQYGNARQSIRVAMLEKIVAAGKSGITKRDLLAYADRLGHNVNSVDDVVYKLATGPSAYTGSVESVLVNRQ